MKFLYVFFLLNFYPKRSIMDAKLVFFNLLNLGR